MSDRAEYRDLRIPQGVRENLPTLPPGAFGQLSCCKNLFVKDREDGTLYEFPHEQQVKNLIKKDSAQVGDIKTTMRTDLSNSWLLCNKSIVSKMDYPDLYNVSSIVKGFDTPWQKTWIPDVNSLNDMQYLNGQWVAVQDTGYVHYTSNLFGTWSKTNRLTTNQTLSKITYGNGTYAVTSNVSNNGYVYYTNNLTGSWSQTKVHENQITAKHIIYANGYWVTAGSQGFICFTSDLGLSWSNARPIDATNEVVMIKHLDGKWIAFSVNYYAYCSDASPGGTWTKKQINATDNPYPTDIDYHDGVWCVLCTDGNVYTATSLDGLWTKNTSPYEYQTNGVIKYVGDRWVKIGKNVFSATNPTGTWNKKTQTLTYAALSTMYEQNMWVTLAGAGEIYYAKKDEMELPEISNGAYNYIKAKED